MATTPAKKAAPARRPRPKAAPNNTVVLNFDRETKNTYRYSTDAEDVPVTQVYVNKSALDGAKPGVLTITLTFGE